MDKYAHIISGGIYTDRRVQALHALSDLWMLSGGLPVGMATLFSALAPFATGKELPIIAILAAIGWVAAAVAAPWTRKSLRARCAIRAAERAKPVVLDDPRDKLALTVSVAADRYNAMWSRWYLYRRAKKHEGLLLAPLSDEEETRIVEAMQRAHAALDPHVRRAEQIFEREAVAGELIAMRDAPASTDASFDEAFVALRHCEETLGLALAMSAPVDVVADANRLLAEPIAQAHLDDLERELKRLPSTARVVNGN